jgi:hypothetical protein
VIDDHVPLAEALRERGFSLRFGVRLTHAGPRVTKTIKKVRALRSCGLAEARNATVDLDVIVERDTHAAAEADAKLLRATGAAVEIELAEVRRFAFDPSDDRRGDQPIERLSVIGLELTHSRGKLGELTIVREVDHGDSEALLAAIDERRSEWSKAGKREADSELEVLEQLSARDLDAEARLRASEGEARSHEAAVYGDWLQAMGDPRGRVATATGDELRRLLDEHAAHCFGPSGPLLDRSDDQWSGPVLASLILRDGLNSATLEGLAELLRTPVCACLAELTLEHWIADGRGLAELFAAAPCAPGLRVLRLAHVEEFVLTGDPFPRLETLAVGSGSLSLASARLPALRRLELAMHLPLAALVSCFAGLAAPRLEHFTLRVASHDFWDQNFGPLSSSLFELLCEPAFHELRTLSLAGSDFYSGSADLGELLGRIPAIATLERIDLREVSMDDGCRAGLDARRDRLPGLLLPGSASSM